MPIDIRPLNTPGEYLMLAREFAALVDSAFHKAENSVGSGRVHDIASRLPVLISLMNTISALRGDNDSFDDIRPRPYSEGQSDLYGIENALERRLRTLVDEVNASGEAEYFQDALKRYYYHLKK